MSKLAFLSAIFCLSWAGIKAQSQAPAWGQCGGQQWNGATSCVSGYVCTVSNPYYSQCIPGTASTTTTTRSTVTPSPTITTSPTTMPGGGTPTTTITGPGATGSQIRAVQAPVYHLYLQNHAGVPQLGPEASSGLFTISGTISLNNADGTKLYLNANTAATTSYKPLTLDATAKTTNWGLEGDTIITTNPRQLNFIACLASGSYYDLFLQTGNDTPSGRSCTLQTIHLPCLC